MSQAYLNFAAERKIYSVSELSLELKNLLEKTFPDVWVAGEVSNFRAAGSGHLYFTLKDDTAQLRAVCFRNQARYLKFKPQDGLAVIARGHLSVYEARGEYQLYVEYLEPAGLGALQLAFEQLKQKLAAEGLFETARKKPLPLLPRTVGVVTSPTGAVIRDILRILRRRFRNMNVLIYPVKVQGEGAAGEIVGGVEHFNREQNVDVVIVARGGGSLEDLWAFNEEMVARAIAACPVPVISGVGHETDFTIADFVADIRAATPTQAAEIVVQRLEEQERRVEDAAAAVRISLERRLERLRARLERGTTIRHLFSMRLEREKLRVRAACAHVAPPRLRRLVALAAQRAPSRQRLEQALRSLIAARRQDVELGKVLAVERLRGRLPQARLMLEGRTRTLEALSPRQVLERGYSITMREGDAAPLREASAVAAGERLRTQLARGTVRSLVVARQGDQGSLFENAGDELPEGRDG